MRPVVSPRLPEIYTRNLLNIHIAIRDFFLYKTKKNLICNMPFLPLYEVYKSAYSFKVRVAINHQCQHIAEWSINYKDTSSEPVWALDLGV